jgi:hypothetical protein
MFVTVTAADNSLEALHIDACCLAKCERVYVHIYIGGST